MPHKIVATTLAGMIAGAMLVTAFDMRWPDVDIPWLGTIGVLPVAIALATVIFLAINSQIAQKGLANTAASLEQARKAEVATRYHKAADLLASDGQTARLGGIFLLKGVAMEEVDTYYLPALELLAAFAAERTHDIFEASEAANRTLKLADGEVDKKQLALDLVHAAKKTPYDAMVAVDVFGKLRAWHLATYGEARASERVLTLDRVSLHGVTIRGGDFSGVHMRDCSFRFARFEGCDFSEADISGLFGPGNRFVDCSVRRFTIDAKHPPQRRRFHPSVRFDQCDAVGIKADLSACRAWFRDCDLGGGARVRAQEADIANCWWEDAPPQMDFDDWDGAPFAIHQVVSEGTWSTETMRGFRVYQPASRQPVHMIHAPPDEA